MKWISLAAAAGLIGAFAFAYSGARARRAGMRLRRFAAAALSLSLAALSGGILLIHRAFHVLSDDAPVAAIEITPVRAQAFLLTYIPEGDPGGRHSFRLSGDQWCLEGGFVRWHPWLTLIGVPKYHIPLRVSGRYRSIREEQTKPRSVFALDGREEGIWRWVYRYADRLPGIDAAYGTAVFTDAFPGRRYRVFATPSGYRVKEQ